MTLHLRTRFWPSNFGNFLIPSDRGEKMNYRLPWALFLNMTGNMFFLWFMFTCKTHKEGRPVERIYVWVRHLCNIILLNVNVNKLHFAISAISEALYYSFKWGEVSQLCNFSGKPNTSKWTSLLAISAISIFLIYVGFMNFGVKLNKLAKPTLLV